MAMLRGGPWLRALVAAGAATAGLTSCATSDPFLDREEEADLGIPEDLPADDDGWISTGVVDPPSPATVEVETTAGGLERIHTVQKGDTLYALARMYYSDASKWRLILESNRDVIRHPDRVFVGQQLRIP